MLDKFLRCIVVCIVSIFTAEIANAECRKVSDNGKIKISKNNLKALEKLNLKREDAFGILYKVSLHETEGCWAGPTGNFDDQIISVGAMQWNYGKGSLQPLMRRFRSAWGNQFISVRNLLLPNHGKLLFSEGCLRIKGGITKECKKKLLKLQSDNVLEKELLDELTNLFEADAMLQIQMDKALTIITSTLPSLKAAFPSQTAPTPRQVHWAIDTHIQRGRVFDSAGITEPSDFERVRAKLDNLTEAQTKNALLGIVKWYAGHCGAIDQAGVRYDCAHNVRTWNNMIDNNEIDKEQIELLHFAYLKERTANGKAGLYQSDAFQRRATIILGAGSVHGRRY
ncbi:hypothetical protein [Labrenzia sp. CE80]|uniref:hypothetical protein n=1 Tax=Labrenzia sp. CE80 TaxID=1788986 RepID=UPI00129B2D19|nr:hypothetical protein [Labrenzia sp. CE80]